VLMDMKMPIMDGYEATRQIKNKYPNLIILALTAFASHEDKTRAIQSGCNNFISKPIDKNILFKTLKKYLKQ